eukprot:15349386-Ditylum_brightwellii.AAC.1
MAFNPTNSVKGDKPKDLIGHQGSVYISWVTECNQDDDNFLGVFRHWKDCKRAVHAVSNVGYQKVKNLAQAFEMYPTMLKKFMTQYQEELNKKTAPTSEKNENATPHHV